MLNSDVAVADEATADDDATAMASTAVLFSFLMHLMGVASISHMIARLLVGSVVALCAHFCS